MRLQVEVLNLDFQALKMNYAHSKTILGSLEQSESDSNTDKLVGRALLDSSEI